MGLLQDNHTLSIVTLLFRQIKGVVGDQSADPDEDTCATSARGWWPSDSSSALIHSLAKLRLIKAPLVTM